MRFCSRKAIKSNNYLQTIQAGSVIAKVTGSVRKLGDAYRNASVVLYSKANLQPIAIIRPDQNGDYSFTGLNPELTTFIIAFDQRQQFNAVIQDNVVPK